MFPKRNKIYSYDAFLQAAAKFPAFCGENNNHALNDLQTCGRELAAILAHLTKETGYNDPNQSTPVFRQALYYTDEMGCKKGGSSACDYKSTGWSETFYPPSRSEQYYGRGPVQISWNYNYGAFSKVYGESTYNSKMYLLEHPDEVTSNGLVAFTSGLWFWMTPQSPIPSMHDVITGFWKPNSADKKAGMKTSNNGLNCFGITTDIINGGIECGGAHNTNAQDRG